MLLHLNGSNSGLVAEVKTDVFSIFIPIRRMSRFADIGIPFPSFRFV
jgi:hypothetical protein